MTTVTALYRSFLKSGRMDSLDEVLVLPTGFDGDRRFVITDMEGNFLSQRSHPKIALLQSGLINNVFNINNTGYGGGFCTVNVDSVIASGAMTQFTIRDFTYTAYELGSDLANSVGQYIDAECRAFMIADPYQRDFGPMLGTDSSPISILSRESMDALLDRVPGASFGIRRFRPSIVVEGCEPHDEDRWRKVRIGEIVIDWRKLAPRCDITLVDQSTGERKGPEPLRTLAKYRRGPLPGGPKKNEVYFASYYFGSKSPGVVCVGDEVEVLEME